MKRIVSQLLYSDNQRTLKIKKNISVSVIFKLFSVLMGFFIIRMTIDYLDPLRYGIWMTILSLVSWINYFDIGLSNGLRNKLTESLAEGNNEKAKTYLSTAYFVFGVFAVLLITGSLIANSFVDYSKLFNVSGAIATEIQSTMIWIVIIYLIIFVLTLLHAVIYANQDSCYMEVKGFITNATIIIMIYILKAGTKGSLFNLGVLYSLVTAVVLVLLSFFFYTSKYNNIMPSFKHIKLKSLKDILNLSAGFFILQITSLIIFTTDNMIITQIFGPTEVTPYQVVYKYFSVVLMGFGFIITPLWSAFTDAYAKKDIVWMEKIIENLVKAVPLIICAVLVMTFGARHFLRLWLGRELHIPWILIIFMAVFSVQACWNDIFAYFVNGIGRIRLQVITAIIGAALNIPLCIIFAKYLNMGISGIIFSTIVSLSFSSIAIPIQTRFILNNMQRAWSNGSESAV